MAPTLAVLINNCFKLSVVPDHFEKAEIVPIYKDKSSHSAQNYGPISLIQNLAKVFEKVLLLRLTSFMVKFDLLHENQYGFKKGFSTANASATLSNRVYESLDEVACWLRSN